MDDRREEKEHEGPQSSQEGEIENLLRPPNSDEAGNDMARDKLITREREGG